jgi:hypothetical protein
MTSVGSKIDALLKLVVCGSLISASGSASYYYLAYRPAQDALAQDALMQIERRRSELHEGLEKHAEQQRILMDQQALEERQAAAADDRYGACMSAASLSYDNSRASLCKRLAEKAAKDRADCIAKGKLSAEGCKIIHELRDAPSACSLPRTTLVDLDDQLEKARKRCLEENRTGL